MIAAFRCMCRRCFICGTFLLALFLPLTARVSAQSESGCFAIVGTTERFIGSVTQSGELRDTAVFINRCPESVTIQSVRSSCGCTELSASKNTVASGDSVKIRLVYRPIRGSKGFVSKTISILLANHQQPVLYRITAKVLTDFELQPKRFDIDSILLGRVTSRSVTVENITDNSIIVSAKTESMSLYPESGSAKTIPFSEVSITPQSLKLAPKERKSVRIELKPEKPGRMMGSIRFSSDNGEQYLDLAGWVVHPPSKKEPRKKSSR